jgi:hypothetical protein
MTYQFRPISSIQFQPLLFWVLYTFLIYVSFQFNFYLKNTHQNSSFDLSHLAKWCMAFLKHPIQITDTYVNIFTLAMLGYVFLRNWISRKKILIIEDNKIFWRISKVRIGKVLNLQNDLDIQYIQIPLHEPSIHLFRLKSKDQEFTINLALFNVNDHDEIRQCMRTISSTITKNIEKNAQ